VLLLALLVLSSVVITSTGLSSLILSSLQQTRAIDSSIVAYYAAESAAEQALYALRRGPDLGEGWAATLTSTEPQALGNGATWTRRVSSTERSIDATIAQDSFLEVALYDPDDESRSLAERAARVEISWTFDEDCAETPCPGLTASVLEWIPGTPNWSGRAVETQRFLGVAGTKTGAASIAFDPDTLDRLRKVRLRAEYGKLKNVQIQAFALDGSVVPLPGRIRIDAWGQYNETQQHLTIRLPRRTPLLGLYDFAIFSECSIVKGYPISCP
jgi:hypothetical protein